MAKEWNGQTYNEDWQPIDAMGNILGAKDWKANANFAAKTGTQNPYTNQAGSSQWDNSGKTPGNEPGSTLPAVGGGAPASGGGLGGAVDAQLLSQITPPSGVNTADPAYQQALNSGKLSNQRAAERSRMAAAQRLHAQGQSGSGALDAAVGGIVQQQGEADQALEAMLMDKFLSADRERAARALTLATGLQGQREGYGLQRELGLADIDLRRQGLNNQQSQFYDSMAQQLGLSTANLNQQAMLALLGA